MLQLWSFGPLRSRVHRAEEGCHTGPRHPSITWSSEGGSCEDWSRQLHHHGGIPEGEQVLAGTFSLNGHPAIILFDSVASHDFISRACTQKHQMAVEYLPTPYMISTPGGKIFTRQVVVNPPLNLGGRVYKTSLIVLEGQGIDVILGMNRMKRHRALVDTAARTIHLDSPEHGNATLQLALTPAPHSHLEPRRHPDSL
jgi:hypothetical protein